MATGYTRFKSKKTSSNIVNQLNTLSSTGVVYTNPLSLLSQKRIDDPSDKLYPVDQLLITIFQRLDGRSPAIHEEPYSSQSKEPPRKRARLIENDQHLHFQHNELVLGLETLLSTLNYVRAVNDNSLNAANNTNGADNITNLSVDQLSTIPEAKEFGAVLGKRFTFFGGLDRILALTLARPKFGTINLQDIDSHKIEIQQLCLEVIRALCLLDKQTATHLAEDTELMQFCFEQLVSKKLFEKSSSLIEVLFMYRSQPLNLCSLPFIQKIIQSLDSQELLSNFCKVLSITISELDVYDARANLQQQNQRKRANNFVPVRDVNQELVLTIPGFLSRLVDLIVREPYLPRYPNNTGTGTELDHWMRLIEDSISSMITTEALSQTIDVSSNFDLVGKQLSARVDAMSVLSLMIIGKHRKEVQKQLAELKLIPKLSNLFDYFVWKHGRLRTLWYLPGHHSGCDCSPEVAVKIQFLRLVHSFCDNCDYKYSLLTPVEYEELERLRSKTVVQPEIVTEHDETLGTLDDAKKDFEFIEPVVQFEPDPELMCRGKKGLLTKIVEVLKKEANTSTFRFWLCRSIESYLKGLISIEADQTFLLRRGILTSVINSLINTDPRHKEIVQSSFDLLGELLKYSREGSNQLDTILNTEIKLKKLMVLVNENLVDSNMFIRAMCLAADHFTGNENLSIAGSESAASTSSSTQTPSSSPSNPGNSSGTGSSKSRLLSFFTGLSKHVDFVERLVKTVRVNTLTQENVSCLNTALVILMINRRRGTLSTILAKIKENQNHNSWSPTAILTNLRNLLLFWQEHYLNKDKDSSQLERSSRIVFSYWMSTVALLVDKDRHDQSILTYLDSHSTTDSSTNNADNGDDDTTDSTS